jgi:hypothetical protein
MQWQRLPDVLQIDKSVYLSVGIAGDIHKRSIAVWRPIEMMDRHNREQLPEGPVIQQ